MPTIKSNMVGALRTNTDKAQEDYWIEGSVAGLNNLTLGVRVSRTGTKKWMARYRVGGRGSSYRRVMLGTYGNPKSGFMDYKAAVKEAFEIHIDTDDGQDPAAEKQYKLRTRLERGKNVAQLVDEFMTRHASVNCAESTTTAYNSFFTNWVIPAIGNRPIGSIKKRDLVEMLNWIADGNESIWPRKEGNPKTAERVRIYCGIMFNWAASEDLIEHSPSLGIKQRAKKEERERVLSDDEIRTIWKASGEIHGGKSIFGQLVRMLFLTGQRSGKTSTMRRGELALGEHAVWSITKMSEKNKSQRHHEVPLSPQALSVLHDVFTLAERDYVFPAKRVYWIGNNRNNFDILNKPLNGMSKLKLSLDIACGCRHKSELGVDGKPLLLWDEDWRLHDIRRTVGTRLGELDVREHIISRILDHKESGVTRIVNRAQYMQQKRDALDAWGRRLDQILNPGSGDNVVPLPKRAG